MLCQFSCPFDEYQLDRILALFRALDFDNSGKLGLDEFLRLGFCMTGRSVSEADAKFQMQQASAADQDHDGFITLTEWYQYMYMLSELPKFVFHSKFDAWIAAALALRHEMETGNIIISHV